jgi:glycerol uptake facilitator-like aquaporin
MATSAYRRYFAEFLGTLALLLFGIGTAELTLNAGRAGDTRILAFPSLSGSS